MSAILLLLMEIVPKIPGLIQAGLATYDLYSKVETVIAEHRSPDEPEWAQLEATIAADKAAVFDKSKDVPTS